MDTNNESVVTASETPAQPAAHTAPSSAPAARPQRPNNMNRGKRRKVCSFCADKIEHIDYKDTIRLRKCISLERAKILPRRVSGTCAMHQRQLTIAIKRARQVALLPYVSD